MMTLLAFYRTLRVVSVMALGLMTLSTAALEKVAVEPTHSNPAQNNQALPASGNWFQYGFKPMGTQAYVEVWAADERQAQQAFAKVEAEFSRVNALMSPWVEQSELSLLNREAAKQPVTVSSEMYQLLKRAAAVSELSQGAFDVTFASVGFQFDYRAHKKPDAKTLASQKQWINYRFVELLPNNQVRYAKSGVKIDLGGIAKGYTVERSVQILANMGIRHALVSAGGDTRLLGDKLGKPWLVAIKHPRQEDRYAAQLPLVNTAISTSGDYERYFIEGGRRYHHILDPKTGESPGELMSVSVIGADATQTDALSTTLFVLGLERGMALIEQIPGYEAVFINKDRKLFFSSGLQ
jgi:thiamine biosynthesis lipoprotein